MRQYMITYLWGSQVPIVWWWFQVILGGLVIYGLLYKCVQAIQKLDQEKFAEDTDEPAPEM